MKLSKKAIIVICLVSALSIGCSKNEVDDNLSTNNIEHDIPYIDTSNYEVDKDGKIITNDSNTITEVYSTSPNDDNYRCILEGFRYYSEQNPTNLTYNEAIELVKKVLPDDINQVNTILYEEVNKEYIYYESCKGNFKVGLCY